MEYYLEKRKKELSEKSYKNLECFLNKHQDILSKSEEEIVEYFSSFSDESKKKYLYNCLVYRREMNLSNSLIEEECKKLKEKIIENNKNKIRVLPKTNVKEKKSPLENLYYNLKTKLPALRSDFSTVKIKNFDKEKDNYYFEGYIYLNNLVKVDGKLILKCPEDLKHLIDNYIFKNDYLLDFESSNRNNYECSILCKKVFGITINEYRKKYITEKFKDKTDIKDILYTALDLCKECNTSIQQIIDYYFCDS